MPRKELKSTPVTSLGSRISSSDYVGIQLHLHEKLAASESDTQKFVFSLVGDKNCYVVNSDPYTRFIKRAINDFEGTVAEFKRLADSLKQSGKSQQIPAYLVPPLNPRDLNAAPDGKAAPPVVVSPESGRESFGDVGVDITSEPAGAEIYVDGKLNVSTPPKIPLSVREHTIKSTDESWRRRLMHA